MQQQGMKLLLCQQPQNRCAQADHRRLVQKANKGGVVRPDLQLHRARPAGFLGGLVCHRVEPGIFLLRQNILQVLQLRLGCPDGQLLGRNQNQQRGNGVAHLADRAAEADTRHQAEEQQHQGIGIGSPPDAAKQPQLLRRRLACLLPMGQEKFRHLLGIHLLIAPPEALKPPNIDRNRRHSQSPANVPDALKKRQQLHAAVFPETDARQRQQHRNPQCSSIGKQIPRKAHPVRPGGLRLLHPV